MSEVANLFDAARVQDEGDPPGYEVPYVRLGPLVGARGARPERVRARAGMSVCPYHYEVPSEEWLIVLAGEADAPRSRGRDGARPRRRRLLPAGARGCPQADEPRDRRGCSSRCSRHTDDRSLSVYPDSDKVGIWSGDGDVALLVPRSAAVDYWHGEL